MLTQGRQAGEASWAANLAHGLAPPEGDEPPGAEECLVRLRELQHRTRNDLQLISALALRHRRRTEDPAAKAGFEAICRHTTSLGRLYGSLLSSPERTGSSRNADLGEHLRCLCAAVAEAKDLADRGIALRVEAEPVVRRAPEAVTALGLAVNELISNAVEHAFTDGRPGCITVRLTAASPGEAAGATLLVADDGLGLADPATGASGIGLGLAEWLVRRAGGKLRRDAAEGTAWEINLA